jgi:hypothetical protein
MQFTFQNLTLTNPADVDKACSILRSFATVPAEMLAATTSININIEADGYVTDALVVPIADAGSVDPVFGERTRAFLDEMVSAIRANGGVTLEDAAAKHGINLDTARAFIRNAGRTAKARGVALPVKPTWDHDKGCNVYGV